MVRITLSSLVSFFVVLLIATACEAARQFKLVNRQGWAKNFPSSGTRPPFITGVIVDYNFASVYERWTVETYEEGYKIRNVGTGFWLTARDGDVNGSSEFNEASSKWYIERAGSGEFTISAPNEDLLVTAVRTQPDYPLSLALRPADGSEEQLWRLEPVDYYSKYRQ
ncbi:hypothetical protein EC968_007627 [Mortierella alpina]|nr:hypothetical protein EC968_007627 [Mortierella alpina]